MRYIFLFFLLSACLGSNSSGFLNPGDWSPVGEATWRYAGKQIVGTVTGGQEGAFMSRRTYDDFELTLDFKPDSTVNSGIFLRCTERAIDPQTCYEFNIWDNNPNPTYRTGGVVLRAEPLAHVETIGHWNTYRLRLQGDRLQAWVNGTMVANLRDRKIAEGYVGLQASGEGTVRFRGVRVRGIE